VNDQELRALVRQAIARHLSPTPDVSETGTAEGRLRHSSHALYHLSNDTDACLIEPSVSCNHCGYCKSHGH
jgi:hypothetical protein